MYDRYRSLRNIALAKLAKRMPIEELSIREPIFNLDT